MEYSVAVGRMRSFSMYCQERSPGYIVEFKKKKKQSRPVFEYTSICEERGENKIIYLLIVLFAQDILQ